MTRTVLFVVLATLAAAPQRSSGTNANDIPPGWFAIQLDQLHWTKTAAGLETAPVFGERSKPELFGMAIRFPAHTVRKAHTHPASRYGLVLAGTFYHGHGNKFDERSLETRVTGTFFSEPAGVPHFGATKDEPAVLYFVGIGPDKTDEVEK